MSRLSFVLVALSGIILIGYAASSQYDPDVSSLDDLDFSAAAFESSIGPDLFSALDGGSESSAIGFKVETDSSPTEWDTFLFASGDGSSCAADEVQVKQKSRHRRGEMCIQGSPEKENPSESKPELPNFLEHGPWDRTSDPRLVLPWDDSECYPPYVEHLCCGGPFIRVHPLTRFYDDVMGCTACSFSLNQSIYRFLLYY